MLRLIGAYAQKHNTIDSSDIVIIIDQKNWRYENGYNQKRFTKGDISSLY